MKTSEITNREDTIDSRDIIARIEELEAELESAKGETGGDDVEKSADLDEYKDELECLNALDSEGRNTFGRSEWESGVFLIADDHFEDYAQELAADIGAITDDMMWPATCIDWEKAASELQMDYSEVEFGSKYYDDYLTFWGRA